MSVSQVIARLRAIDRQLPDDDGVRWFNELYLDVTRRVDTLLQTQGFEDAVFIQRLDEIFAKLYFAAVDGGAAAAWQPLLKARLDVDIAPGRFMLAGINAHVNYDLPIALVQTRGELGGELIQDTPRHRDFERIDMILAEVEHDMRDRLEAGRLREVIALWGVIRARERAWNAAVDLAHLNATGQRPGPFLRQLADQVAQWSELLLHMPT